LKRAPEQESLMPCHHFIDVAVATGIFDAMSKFENFITNRHMFDSLFKPFF
jgi:hypothetical protein